MAAVELKAQAMDSTSLLLLIGPLLLGLIFNAAKFMRFIGKVAGGGKRQANRGRSFDDQMSFDERVAERLRELDRQRH